jgi:tRNA nucleotidyltransferase (CCA-adding enzyme)
MAMDAQGQLIDPYHGQDDLHAKILRHVSPAFIEDPVRVLRVARFAARYHHLGFRLANETRTLMYAMVKRGELNHLVAERVWQEWERSLQEKNPEVFITTLRSCGALSVVLPELDVLFGIPNPSHYHHEIDTGIHTLMVLCSAVALSEEPLLRFAALTHDLGKACTPINAWPAHPRHEELGVAVIQTLSKRLRIPKDYKDFAILVSRAHIHIHRVQGLGANTIVNVLEETDAFRRKQRFEKLLMVCMADAQGKGHVVDYPQVEQWQQLLDACANISIEDLIAEGLQGEKIKISLHDRRVACVDGMLNTWKKA